MSENPDTEHRKSDPQRKTLIVRVVLSISVIAGSVAIYQAMVLSAPQLLFTEGQLKRRVVVMSVTKIPVSRQWRGYGTVQAVNSADVPAQVAAVVEHIPDSIAAGAVVVRGQLLAQLEDRDFRCQVEIAKQKLGDLTAQLESIEVERRMTAQQLALELEDLDLATQELSRVQQLRSEGVTHKQEADRAKRVVIAVKRANLVTRLTLERLPLHERQLLARIQAQQELLELAQTNLRRCRIVSPIDGVLQSVDVEVGESVSIGQRVARAVDLRTIEVPLRIPASARSGIVAGDGVRLTTATGPGLDWSARVARVAPEDDPATRTMTVYVEVDQADVARHYARQSSTAPLVPGTFLEGLIESGKPEMRWVVPERSFREDRLLIVSGGGVVSRPARIDFTIRASFPQFGVNDQQWVVLKDELEDGELVVVNTAASLLDGQAVEPVLAQEFSVDETPDQEGHQ